MSLRDFSDPPGNTSCDRERASTAGDAWSTSVHVELRRQTAALHEALETELDLLDPNLSSTRYRRVLCTFHGFYAPVEAGLA